MEIKLLTKRHQDYIKKKTASDICISCRKPFSCFRQNHLKIGNSDEFNYSLGENDYLVEFVICNDCFESKFKSNMEFAIELYKLKEKQNHRSVSD